ncbi:Putative teichuronic acid biosynthesis glycosyltransferase TuaC [BD1-7 clade bacterium]|uniref:Teichuronic acid biosynthesis glycosyltransferase TuaC n=1 Tax=BD1-7 clade bacterium TaxID=2029982 RepID=A0A5S9N2V0_9GAMM|nr:Putative teichuronic acid biosynthesis glycosyltransferase TuaC [BD1-7 clade bacterium]CAA0083150.1 Putative teichuronic acid biosynthesis glycosyltransferase TuaC [BD1-7 clade bacterium]
MKILILHNRYQQAGGEDSVVHQEYAMLKRAGHTVELLEVNNDNITGIKEKITTALRVIYSRPSKQQVAMKLSAFKPDIVHCHNIFPRLSASVYDACRDHGVPVVQTLHNYRFVCPTAILMLKGKPCERSIHHSPFWALRYKVYQGSLLGTFILCCNIAFHRWRNTWNTRVDRFITLTEFSRQKFIEAGFTPNKLAVKPNFFTPDNASAQNTPEIALPDRFALYVGRLSDEKGIEPLIEAFSGIKYPLVVVGDGPLMETLQSANLPDTIHLVGRVPSAQIPAFLEASDFLVLPSLCYEGFPMTIAEAFACSTPVIASRLGSMAEIVTHQSTGLLCPPGDADSLREAVLTLAAAPATISEYGQNAFKIYQQQYTEAANYQRLMQIYQEAIND